MELGDLVGGRWRLTGHLGRGGFGQVFRAVDTSRVGLGDAAVKILHPGTSARQVEDFLAEVQNVARMRHPNLVSYLDSGEYELSGGRQRAYLVTELCRYSLADELSRRPDRVLGSDEAEVLVAEIAAGLGHLHDQGLLHRDLKSANILWADDGWKLADFGLTRSLTATGNYHRSEMLTGTPRYMAPELFTSSSSGQPADVYALGVVVHEALTGRFPYDADDYGALILRISSEDPTLDPSLDARWRQFVSALLRREPTERPVASQLPALVAAPPASGSFPMAGTGAPGPRGIVAGSGPIPAIGGAGPASSPFAGGAGPGRFPGHDANPASLSSPSWPSEVAVATVEASGVAQGGRSQARGTVGPLIVGVVVGLLAVAAVGVMAARDRGEATDRVTAEVPTDVPAAPGTGDSNPGDGTRATSSTVAALPPDQRIEQVILSEADGPEGYRYRIVPPDPDSQFCVGVDSPSATHPGLASQRVDFAQQAQYFLVGVTVHQTADDAHLLLNTAERLRSSCDGQPIDSAPGAMVAELSEMTEIEVPGADEVVATTSVARGSDVVVELFTIYARVGDLTMLSTGSHRATVQYHAQLMVARAIGADPPPAVEPSGPSAGAFDADAAASVRTTAGGSIDSPGLQSWLEGHDDADIDLVMDRACSGMDGSTDEAGITASLGEVYRDLPPEVGGDLAEDDFFRFVGVGIVFYCPDRAEILTGAGEPGSG